MCFLIWKSKKGYIPHNSWYKVAFVLYQGVQGPFGVFMYAFLTGSNRALQVFPLFVIPSNRFASPSDVEQCHDTTMPEYNTTHTHVNLKIYNNSKTHSGPPWKGAEMPDLGGLVGRPGGSKIKNIETNHKFPGPPRPAVSRGMLGEGFQGSQGDHWGSQA